MNLYEACVSLNVWQIAKARAEIWRQVKTVEPSSLDALKALIKSKFKELVLIHHPDHGGSTNRYITIQAAYEVICNATINDFMWALDLEHRLSANHYKPGAHECTSCGKWSGILNTCVTTVCTGIEPIKRKSVSFDGQGLEYVTV